MTTDTLPTHDTRVVPSLPGGIHFIEYIDSEIFMMDWDGEAPQTISLYEESNFVGYTSNQRILRPFMLTPYRTYRPPLVSLVYFQHSPLMTPFILLLKGYGPAQRDVQIVTRSGRVAHPQRVNRPLAGTTAREGIQREDDEILRQLRTTQAHISI